MLKKTISVLLIMLMITGVIHMTPIASAEEIGDVVPEAFTSSEDITVTGNNSLGAMLAAEYGENTNDTENTGSNIYAVEINGNTAYADIRALVNAKLIISIFDEAGKEMYGSGIISVTPDDTIVEVPLEINTMPLYFIVRAFMLDDISNLPLCKQFESTDYTQEMQDFFAKTSDDFDEDKVLNLDDNHDDNFLVFSDDTIIIDNSNQETNIVTKADDEAKKYVIESINDSFTSLKAGDIFSYDYGDGNLLIIKIDSITIDGTTAEINGSEIGLEEVFDYIHIDVREGLSENSIDNTDLDEDLEYAGIEKEKDLAPIGADDSDIAASGAKLIDYTGTKGVSLKYKFKEYDSNSDKTKPVGLKVSGSVTGKFDAEVKCYWDQHFTSHEIKFSFALKYEIGLNVGFEFSASKKWQLGKADIPVIPGIIDVAFTPSFVVEGKITGELNGKLSGQFGFSLLNGNISSDNKSPKFTAEVKITAEVFVGISLEPAVEVLCGVTKAKATLKGGVKIKGEMKWSAEADPDERHLCKACIDGSISFVAEGSVSLIFFDSEKLEFKATFLKREWKLFDFYYSIDNHQFGLDSCPNWSYRITITVLDEDKQPLKNVSVNGIQTDEIGKAEIYLKKGFSSIVLEKNGKKDTRPIMITKAQELTITFNPDNANIDNSINPMNNGVVVNRSLYSGGDGTLNNPYQIRTVTQLSNIRKNLTSHYILMSDIDLSTVKKWNKIGDRNHHFTGSLDGNNHTISNMNIIDVYGEDSSSSYVGLFSYLEDASVSNLTLSDVYIRVYTSNVGAIAGEAKNSSIINCNVIGLVYGVGDYGKNTAGVVGSQYAGIIHDTSFTGTVIGTNTSGALTSINTGVVSNCKTYQGKIYPETFGNYQGVYIVNSGGIVGNNSGVIVGCVNRIAVIGNAWSGSTTGGIASINSGTITRCCNYGTVRGVSGRYSGEIGGICGKNTGKIQNCYNAARVTSDRSTVFGITDNNSYSGGLVEYCYNIGYLDGMIDRSGSDIQYEFGISSYGEAKNSYYLDNVPEAGSGTRLSSLEMQSAQSYNGFDFNDVWFFDDNFDYPQLREYDYYENDCLVNNAQSHKLTSAVNVSQDRSLTETDNDITIFLNRSDSRSTSSVGIDNTSIEAEFEEYIYMRAHLVSFTESVLLIVNDNTNEHFNPNNLLYIAQQTVDETGTVSFTAYGDFGKDEVLSLIIGECDHESSDWIVTKESTESEDGLKVQICDYCNNVLDTEIISALTPIVLGDVDNDGTVTIVDATFIQRKLASIPIPFEFNEVVADTDEDDSVTIIDATCIQRWLVGLQTNDNIGKLISK